MLQYVGWGSAIGGALFSMFLGVMAPAVHMEGAEGVEKTDLSELADGEVRTFGEGDHAIVAERDGDVIEITLPGRDDAGERTLRCGVGKGSCYAFTTGDGAGAKMIFLGEEGEGLTKKHVSVIRVGSGDHLEADEDKALIWVGEGEAEASHVSLRTVIADALGGVKLLHLGEKGRLLRCPEGDTTMRLDTDDADTYYCPKHDVALKESEGERIIKTIEIHTDTDDE